MSELSMQERLKNMQRYGAESGPVVGETIGDYILRRHDGLITKFKQANCIGHNNHTAWSQNVIIDGVMYRPSRRLIDRD